MKIAQPNYEGRSGSTDSGNWACGRVQRRKKLYKSPASSFIQSFRAEPIAQKPYFNQYPAQTFPPIPSYPFIPQRHDQTRYETAPSQSQDAKSHPSSCSSLSLSSSSPSLALVLRHLLQARIRPSLPTPRFSLTANLAPPAPAGATGTTARVRITRGMAWASARPRIKIARAEACVMARSTHATPMDVGALRTIIGARRASTRAAGARREGG